MKKVCRETKPGSTKHERRMVQTSLQNPFVPKGINKRG